MKAKRAAVHYERPLDRPISRNFEALLIEHRSGDGEEGALATLYEVSAPVQPTRYPAIGCLRVSLV